MKITIRPYRGDKTRKRWEADIWFRDASGMVIRTRMQAPATSESGARAWGEKRLAELLRHGMAKEVEQKPLTPKLSEYVDGYISHCEAERQKGGTLDHKRGVFATYLVPLLADRRISEIGEPEVKHIKAEMKHLSPKTVNNVLSVLSTVLKLAEEDKLIEHAPRVKLLKVRDDGERPFYDFADFDRLVKAAAALDERYKVMVLLGGEAGLRLGEIIALEQSAVLFDRRLLRVQCAEYRGHVGLPKGNRKRDVGLTTTLSAALHGLRHLRGVRVLYDDGGQPVTEKVLRMWMRATQRRAGMEVNGRIHILRHSFCSHLAMRGAPAKAIQELAGHASLTTTMRYMHLSPATRQAAIDALNDRKRDIDSVVMEMEAGNADRRNTGEGGAEKRNPA